MRRLKMYLYIYLYVCMHKTQGNEDSPMCRSKLVYYNHTVEYLLIVAFQKLINLYIIYIYIYIMLFFK